MSAITTSSHPVILRENDQEYLLSVHASMKLRARKITPNKWDMERRCWVYRHTPEVYSAIRAEFGSELVDESCQTDMSTTELGRLRKENAQYLQSLATLRSENQDLRQQAAAEQQYQTLSSKLAQLESVILPSQAIALEKQLNAKWERVIHEKEQEIENLQASNGDLTQALAELKGHLNEAQKLKQAYAELNRILTDQKKRYHELELQATSPQSVANLQQLVQAKDRQILTLQGDVKQLQTNLQQVGQQQSPAALLRETAIIVSAQNRAFKEWISHRPVDTDLAMAMHRDLQLKLQALVGGSTGTLAQLIDTAQERGLIDKDTADLAHLIRRQRNKLAHPSAPYDTKEKVRGLVVICLFAGALLWSQFENEPASYQQSLTPPP